MFKKVLSGALALMLAVTAVPVSADGSEESGADSRLGALIETVEGAPAEMSLSFASAQEMLNGMRKITENGNFELYYNTADMTLGIKNKASGEIFTSNPYDAATDPMYTGDVKNNYESQVIVSFYDSEFNNQNLWSSQDCLSFGQFSSEIYENGVAVDLSIGEDKGKLIVPIAMTVEDYEKYTASLESRDSRKLSAFYSLYSSDGYVNEEMITKYPTLKDKELYVLEESMVTDKDREDISDIFSKAGYTYENYISDMEKLGIEIENQVYPNFKLRVEYILTDKGLTVTIPNESIVCSDGFQLLEISLLPYFGCDKPQNGKNGYLFVPDGSGALININGQPDTRQTAIAGRVYGENPVTDEPFELSTGETYHLPVFGAVRNDGSAFAAIITSGDVADFIVALLGGPNGQYYTVYNRFLYTEYEPSVTQPKIVSMGSTQNIYISDENRYTCDYSVDYYFLTGEKANYTGMAEIYRNYLSSKGFKTEDKKEEKIAVQTIGAALIEKDFLGIPYKSEMVFTSYEDAMNILKDLKEEGIENLSLSMLGWEKKGLDATISNKIRFSSKQGGKSGFKDLAEYCQQEGISLTLGNEFLLTKYNRMFDGFGVKSSACQTLELSTAEFYEYRSFSEMKESSLYITSPVKYEKYAEKLAASAAKNDITAITLNTLGNYLVADFSERHSVNRQQTIEYIENLLKNSSEKVTLNFDGANAYVLPYADTLEEVPCSSSGLSGESVSVPFLQIVVSGSIKLHSKPINLEGESNSLLLDCLRCGVTPTYLVASDNIEQLKKTDYSRYFAINYEYVRDEIISAYADYSDALEVLSSSAITDSTEVSSNVYCSVYEGGTKIYTNYGETDYDTGSGKVKAGGYLIIRG